MSLRRRSGQVLLLGGAIGLLSEQPAGAHGVGGRSDLPLPLWIFALGASIALGGSFVIVSYFWHEPRLDAWSRGRELPGWIQAVARVTRVVLQVVGLALLGLMITAAFWGNEITVLNITPFLIYIWFWVGMQVLSAGIGDVWRALSPYETVVGITARVTGFPRDHGVLGDPGHWVAAAMLFSFVWLELAYFEKSVPQAIGVWLVAYSVAALMGSVVWGRRWLRYGEGFAGLFGLLAAMSPLHRREGAFRIQIPVSGLAHVEIRDGTIAVVMVVLGSTSFDGLTRTTFWLDIAGTNTGWDLTLLLTAGVLWMIGIAWVLYAGAMRLMARIVDEDAEQLTRLFLPSLVPIVLAYTVAHYFSLVFFEGQNVLALASDPLGRGWDLFGTAGWGIDYTTVSVATIAWVQAGSIVIGHIIAVLVAHDRAVDRWDLATAIRSQYPLLAVMLVYTVGGMALLMGG